MVCPPSLTAGSQHCCWFPLVSLDHSPVLSVLFESSLVVLASRTMDYWIAILAEMIQLAATQRQYEPQPKNKNGVLNLTLLFCYKRRSSPCQPTFWHKSSRYNLISILNHQQPIKMQLEQLIYTKSDITTSDEHPCTFVLMVDGDMYEKQKKDKSIPLASVVDSFDILVR